MTMRLTLESLNLAAAEKKLCDEALTAAGTIVDAARLLGITRHALKRRIIKHQIEWPRPKFGPNSLAAAQAAQAARVLSTQTPSVTGPTATLKAVPRD